MLGFFPCLFFFLPIFRSHLNNTTTPSSTPPLFLSEAASALAAESRLFALLVEVKVCSIWGLLINSSFLTQCKDQQNSRDNVTTLERLVHSVWFERDVRRIDFVMIFFQWTQNWTALNLKVNFRALIQPYSSGLQNSFCRGS